MDVTEIRVKLMNDPHERLLGFCSLTLDGSFVVRDLKIIHGLKGPFVAMPSRKLMDHCPRCVAKNHLRARFCNECGLRMNPDRAMRDGEGRAKLYADIAHPIHSDCRDLLQQRILAAYQEEITRSRLPGYVCAYDDYGEDRVAQSEEFEALGELPRVLSMTDSRRREHPSEAGLRGPHGAARRAVGAAAWSTTNEDESFGSGLT